MNLECIAEGFWIGSLVLATSVSLLAAYLGSAAGVVKLMERNYAKRKAESLAREIMEDPFRPYEVIGSRDEIYNF